MSPFTSEAQGAVACTLGTETSKHLHCTGNLEHFDTLDRIDSSFTKAKKLDSKEEPLGPALFRTPAASHEARFVGTSLGRPVCLAVSDSTPVSINSASFPTTWGHASNTEPNASPSALVQFRRYRLSLLKTQFCHQRAHELISV